jgi:hypothetical protein
MRWPYNPLSENDSEPTATTVAQFKTLYNITDPVGNVKDYQNRKVMVYSPSTGKAVVCKPAYFMWGKNTVRAPGQKDGSRDEFGNSTRIDVDNGRKRKRTNA